MQVYLKLLSSIFIERSIVIQNIDELKSVTGADFVIVWIMGRCDLHCTSSKLLINLFIDDNGKTPVQKGMNSKLAVKVLQT